MPKRVFLLFFCLLVAACGRPQPASFHSTDITGADFGRQFALTDHTGKPRTLADYRGKLVILFFGYTSCPDVCPTTLSRFAEVVKAMGAEGSRVQVLFVTVDPARDTREKLASYVPWFHPSFVGLYGDAAATEATAREFKIFYARKELEGGTGYVIDHSAGSYVFDTQGRLRLYVKDEVSNADLVADLGLLLAEK